MTRSLIDWSLVARAVAEYGRRGYHYVEAPWFVSEEALGATLPPGRHGHRTLDGPLVGSAEQSFIQMMLDGELPPGRYVAATPCFRDDDPDELHQRYFFKVELVHVLRALDAPASMALAEEIVFGDALAFFRRIAPSRALTVVRTPGGRDIQLGGVEVGSYGCRSFRGHRWVYGTGFADPRFTVALRRFESGEDGEAGEP